MIPCCSIELKILRQRTTYVASLSAFGTPKALSLATIVTPRAVKYPSFIYRFKLQDQLKVFHTSECFVALSARIIFVVKYLLDDIRRIVCLKIRVQAFRLGQPAPRPCMGHTRLNTSILVHVYPLNLDSLLGHATRPHLPGYNSVIISLLLHYHPRPATLNTQTS